MPQSCTVIIHLILAVSLSLRLKETLRLNLVRDKQADRELLTAGCSC